MVQGSISVLTNLINTGAATREFTNTVQNSATLELLDFLGKQGILWEAFQAARKPISEAHNRQEPGFAKSIERHALKGQVILLVDA